MRLPASEEGGIPMRRVELCRTETKQSVKAALLRLYHFSGN